MENHENGLYKLFIEELGEMYNSEKQIVGALPKLIELATLGHLKQAIEHHLKESEQHVVRIEKIFAILEMQPVEHTSEAIAGLLREADAFATQERSAALDAAIICTCQKVEHYEIATYGTLRSFARQLDLDSKVVDYLTATIDEEGSADRGLTKIAEGSFFKSGVNKKATQVA
ncbi:MAG: DUF892 family protein [Chlamydiales bacterium]|nr:DUF892 family protein [Chlamydiales bacterium]